MFDKSLNYFIFVHVLKYKSHRKQLSCYTESISPRYICLSLDPEHTGTRGYVWNDRNYMKYTNNYGQISITNCLFWVEVDVVNRAVMAWQFV